MDELLSDENPHETLQNLKYSTVQYNTVQYSTIQYRTWYRPSPGHSPRFDPKKLRDSMKLNWSTETLLTLTLWSKCNLENINNNFLVAKTSLELQISS